VTSVNSFIITGQSKPVKGFVFFHVKCHRRRTVLGHERPDAVAQTQTTTRSTSNCHPSVTLSFGLARSFFRGLNIRGRNSLYDVGVAVMVGVGVSVAVGVAVSVGVGV